MQVSSAPSQNPIPPLFPKPTLLENIPMTLSDKKIILTGAGGALAHSVAVALLEAGAELILVGRGDGPLCARDRLGAGTAVSADLSTLEGALTLREHISGASSLVHTVGAFSMGKVRDAQPGQLEAMMSANFYSLVYTVQACLPELEKQGDGAIVGISAGQVKRGEGAGAAFYTASKAAVSSFLGALDLELGGNLNASVLYPMGAFDTPANRRDMPHIDPLTWISPRDMAEAVVFLLTRGRQGRVRELSVFPPRAG